MSENSKHIVAAAWVVAVAGSVVAGAAIRDRIDLSGPGSGPKIENLVASRDNGDGVRPQTEIPAGDFFFDLTEKLKQEYVEPITDDAKLASGAVRGMIGYLGDPKSIYMDKDEFRAYLKARQGQYEGIGADLEVLISQPNAKANRSVLQPTPTEEDSDPRQQALAPGGASVPSFPRLTVTSVVPGGPADKAGVKAGDQVYSVDDHWIINGDLAARFYKAEKDFKAKSIPLSALNDLRKEVRTKYERMLLPLRAKAKLFLGNAGVVKVVWDRPHVGQVTTSIDRAPSQRPGFTVNNDTINLPLTQGVPEQLHSALAGKSAVTIDLRNNTLGDFGVMRKCLAELAPAGNYGYEATDRNTTAKPTPLTVVNGNSKPPKITVLTDRTTRGAAEVLALALSSKGVAKLSGNETGGSREVFDVVQLPDGSGYTLVTSRYRTQMDIKTAKVAKK